MKKKISYSEVVVTLVDLVFPECFVLVVDFLSHLDQLLSSVKYKFQFNITK